MDIIATVKARLAMLGYSFVDADAAALAYVIGKAEAWLCDDLNLAAVPSGLLYAWADMAAGMFLLDRKSSGQLCGYTFETSAKSISEGDTTVAFATGASEEGQFDALIKKLVTPDEAALAAYRRIAW
ncbi:MAG: hypothetical protein RSE64_07515 [Oscillospiraceae bacterium]